MAEPDWELLQTFLRATDEGSFTGAAKKLGVSQPTVSRRIDLLEEAVGAALFIRHSRGLKLTDRGAVLLDAARGVDTQIQEVYRRAGRGRTDPEGVVRISANEIIAVYALPDILRSLRWKYPDLQVEVDVDNSSVDLSRREADIAVRMFKPTQGDLLAQHLGDVEVGFFASKRYLQQHPMCEDLEMSGHTFIGLDLDPSWPAMLEELGLTKNDFPVRTDSLFLHIAAAEAGAGIAVTHKQIGQLLSLQQLEVGIPLPRYPVWLVRHEALRNDLAVRTVLGELEVGLRNYIAAV